MYKFSINIIKRLDFQILKGLLTSNLIILLLMMLFRCNNVENKGYQIIGTQDTCFYFTIPYMAVLKEEKSSGDFLFDQDNKFPVYVGSILFMSFDGGLRIKTVKLQRILKSSKNQLFEYKLYLNTKYAGKFKENQTLDISSSVNSIRVELIKTQTGKVIKAWDNEYNYTMIKDTSFEGIKDLQIKFKLDSTDQSKVLIREDKKLERPIDLESILSSIEEIPERPVVLSKKEKKQFSNYEQIINFSKSGTFQVHLIKANRKTRSIENDLFYYGTYDVFLAENHRIGYILKGEISGMTNNKWCTKTLEYKINSKPGKPRGLKNEFPYEILIDLPDRAMSNIQSFDGSITVNIPYATENNIIGKKLYTCNKCYLRYIVIKSILKAKKDFNQRGLDIKLLDCYRPLDVQKLLYDEFPVKGYVADPIGGSIHNRGTAVDLTFIDMNRKDVEMGSGYDEFSSRSHVSYTNLSDTIIKKREFLHQTMKKHNFVPIKMEWWHFEFDEARKYPKINDPFPCYDNK